MTTEIMTRTMGSTNEDIKLRISDKDIITEEDQNLLMYIRDVERTNYFLIGDLAAKYINRTSLMGLPVTHAQIFDAIGRFCGKKGRTIRYYYETAVFFSQEEREEFDMLPFSFFVFARKLGDESKSVLEYAARNPYMTLDALKVAFGDYEAKEKIYEGDEIDSYRQYKQLGFGVGETETPPGEKYVSPAKKFSNSVLISTISELVDTFDRLVERVKLPDRTRDRLLDSLREIRELIPEILQAMEEN
jgi:hypothetical protein